MDPDNINTEALSQSVRVALSTRSDEDSDATIARAKAFAAFLRGE